MALGLDNMFVGESYAYELNAIEKLEGKSIKSYSYEIYDSCDQKVTLIFGRGSSEKLGIITFGIKAVYAGEYVLKFIIMPAEQITETLPLTQTLKLKVLPYGRRHYS
jgi:hypothetical protein